MGQNKFNAGLCLLYTNALILSEMICYSPNKVNGNDQNLSKYFLLLFKKSIPSFPSNCNKQ